MVDQNPAQADAEKPQPRMWRTPLARKQEVTRNSTEKSTDLSKNGSV
jgi:hypothetical protein